MFMVEYYTVYLMFCLVKCIHVNVFFCEVLCTAQ